MSENLEFNTTTTETNRGLGELAMQTSKMAKPFEVEADQLLDFAPSLNDGQEVLNDIFRNHVSTTLPPGVALSQIEPSMNRKLVRQTSGQYGKLVKDILGSGGLYLASFDTPEEGEELICELFPGHTPFMEQQFLQGVRETAQSVRQLKNATSEIALQLKDLEGDDQDKIASRYTLLKSLAGTETEESVKARFNQFAFPANEAATVAIVMQKMEMRKNLATEARSALFDRHIARDILNFVNENPDLDSNLTKIRQLVKYSETFLDNGMQDKDQLFDRMIAVLDNWPPSHRQIVTEIRDNLATRFESNLNQAERFLKENHLVATADTKAVFLNYIDKFAAITARLVGGYRPLRTRVQKAKKRNKPKSLEDKASTDPITDEQLREPRRIVRCNIADDSTDDNVESLVDNFMQDVGQPSNQDLRSDINNILTFMARTDLPLHHPRGIKPIKEVQLRFNHAEYGDKLWRIYEQKALEASGLPTKTEVAKNLRVYFIKLSETDWGVFSISLRKQQKALFQSIRAKNKQP